MDIRVLRYFLEVVKLGTITKAANALHITQPTLSRQLMDLEEEVGTKLLHRGKRQVTLTDSGVLYHQRVTEIVTLLDKTKTDLLEQNEAMAGNIVIGCVETRVSILLADVINDFHKNYPKVTYELYTADGDDIREKLDRGTLDFGLLIEPVETARYDFVKLPIEDEWCIICRKDDPLGDKELILAEDLVGRDLMISRRHIVVNELEQWLGIRDKQLKVIGVQNLLSNSLLLVEKGEAIIVTVRGAYELRPKENLRCISIHPRRTSHHVLAWKKNRKFPSNVRKFMEHIETMVQE